MKTSPKQTSQCREHTPGPWVVAESGLSVTTKPEPTKTIPLSLSGQAGSERMEMRASVIARCGGMPDSKANARLIAAAPELLEACKEALEHFNKYVPGIALDCVDSLRMAINRATGKGE
jgi:hypothetical protein